MRVLYSMMKESSEIAARVIDTKLIIADISSRINKMECDARIERTCVKFTSIYSDDDGNWYF